MNKTARPRFTYTFYDDEIIEDVVLAITQSCDEDTWLYVPETKSSFQNQFGKSVGTSDYSGIHETSPSGGGVDSRTFCRRRKSSHSYNLGMSPFPAFGVADLNNTSVRSSLGILNGSINDTLMDLGGRGRSSCGFTASEAPPTPAPPMFRLGSPFADEPPAVLKPARQRYEISRMDSESLEDSVPLSLRNDFSLERNSVMTSSMMRFVNDRSKPSRESAAARREREPEPPMTGATIESMTGSVLLSMEMTDSTASDAENVPPPPARPLGHGQTADNRLAERDATPSPEYIVADDAPVCPAEKDTLNETYTMKRSLGAGDDSDRSLNNKDMNRTYDLEFANRTNDAMTRTFTRESPAKRSLPGRHSGFNSTFTRMTLPGSTETLEDDRASNASDSSCSVGSATECRGRKPRSVEDLRAEAHRQQATLEQHSLRTSTPESTKRKTPFANWQVTPNVEGELSPVLRCNTATITRPSAALSKLRRPPMMKTSVTVVNGHSQRFDPEPHSVVGRRPSTAPLAPAPLAAAPSAIPRPRPSRLPMPKLRSGIPMVKRGGLH